MVSNLAKVAIAMASATLGVAVVGNVPAQAIDFNFVVTVEEGSLAGEEFLGSFSFDDAGLTGVGTETFGVAEGLEIDFTFDGVDFAADSDIFFPDFPIVEFTEGVLAGLNFAGGTIFPGLFTPDFTIASADDELAGGDFFSYNTFEAGSGTGTVAYSEVTDAADVPEPSFVFALLGLGLLLKQVKRDRTVAEA
ncbi:MAG: hypothetical protein AAF152_09730 [Cyanobacteria bacterium P01_A01_bin.114]